MRNTTRLASYAGLLIAIAGLVAGCSTNKVLPAQVHAPSMPDSIKLYSKAPRQYEKLGIVETTEHVKWQEGDAVDPCVNDLKAKAAALGANGLLLIVDEHADQKGLLAIGSYKGHQYQFPIVLKPVKKAMATAIFVVKE